MSPLQTLPPPPTVSARLLVVGAQGAGCEPLAAALRAEGYDVHTCATAANLAERVRSAAWDLVLLSIPAPGVSWAEACEELRLLDESRTAMVILFAAGATDETTVVEGLEAGAHDFINSADRLDELKARVRVQLRRRHERELLHWASAQRVRYRTEAFMDPLTGIGNRRAAEAGLSEALSVGTAFMLVMLDLDDFKLVNDAHGHAAGDAVLRALARSLDGLARGGDVVARYGGDEFLLILNGVQPEQAQGVAQRFRRTVAALSFEDVAHVGGITVSSGAVTWSGQGPPPSAHRLLQAADEALYEAKGEGRDRVVVSHLDRDPEVSAADARA